MEILISIIIPMYNVERYIAKCLDSVYSQDISESEYEVICVNDASPDNSRDIVIEYQKKHKNLTLIDHQTNKKLGSARNSGAIVAKGKYIWHVDSDDMIALNCLKSIVSLCEEKKLDVLEFGFLYVDENDVVIPEHRLVRSSEVIIGQEYIKRYFLSNFGQICPIWRKVYRRSFLEMNHIVSPPINMGEDEPYAIQVFTTAQRVAYEPKDWYIHRKNITSLAGERKKNWSAIKWYEVTMECTKYLNDIYRKLKPQMTLDIRCAVENMIKYQVLYFQKNGIAVSQEIKTEYWKLCRRNVVRNLFVFRYMNLRRSVLYLKGLFCK